VETQCDSSIRASAQGLFMMMTNGFGAIFGSWVSGIIIGAFFTDTKGHFIWMDIWNTFAIYSLIIALFFWILFKHKHDPKQVENIAH
jgi:NHS family xanthosine MFS transporter